MARKKSATNRSIASNGYVIVWMPNHPRCDIRGYIYEHRLLAETKIGRPILSKEQVHHIDGNRRNNNPDNLMVLSSMQEHRMLHRVNVNSNLRNPGEINVEIACECGCGTIMRKYDSSGRPRRFVSGHNSRKNGTK